MRVRWEGPGDTGESEPGARLMRKYTSTARRVMRRGHRQMPRDSRVLPHLVTDHLSRDKTPEPWTSAWQRKRDTWHTDGESVTSETIKIKLTTVTTRRRMVWRWVIIICHARYLFLEFNSSAQFKLSTCTSYKTVTTAVLWGSYSQLLKCILCKEDDIVTFLVLTLQHFTGPKIRCKNVQQNRNRCCATRERKYKSFLLIITPAVFKYHSVTSSATNYKPHCCLENEQQ